SEDAGAWEERERICGAAETALVLKFSVVPTKIAECCDAIRGKFARAEVVAQSIGLGVARCEGSGSELLSLLTSLRQEIRQLGGTLSLLSAPLEIKQQFDVLGEMGSS